MPSNLGTGSAAIPSAISNPLIYPADSTIRFEVLPKDLSAYRAGNTGVPFAFRFDSGKPGPHVAINALTHGNEFCGMTAVSALLDAQIRPERGLLSLSFANVAAYESFKIDQPFESRMLVHNLNRIWSPAQLDGHERSPDLDRAREMRPFFQGIDSLLDIHSTSQRAQAFFVAEGRPANRQLADAIALPPIQMWMPEGMTTGTPLIEYPQLGAGLGALVVECGQHFEHKAGIIAIHSALKFLVLHGTISEDKADSLSHSLTGSSPFRVVSEPVRRFEMLSVHVIRSSELRWVRPLYGMEVFAKDELIGKDGDFEIRSPCEDCTVFMPHGMHRVAVPGREGIYLCKPI